MLKWYNETIEKEDRSQCFEEAYREWAHSKGFYAESACSYNLTQETIDNYLSDYNYLKVWPLNGWTRIWVNDKLTLKYMLANTAFDKLMPEYYYYSTPKGLRSLVDNPYKEATDENFLRLLSETSCFACKPCNGTTAIGFVKLSFDDGGYFINHQPVSKGEILSFVQTHPNYVFTEYIKPSPEFSRYSPLIHTLRIVTLNENGTSRIVGGYLRLPCSCNGEANYTLLNDTQVFNVFVNVDLETGEYGNAKKIFINRVVPCMTHPDTGVEIKGRINNYKELKQTVLSIADRFNTLEWLGFDIGVTDKGFKCMEINTHPGIKYMQTFKPLLSDSFVKDYFSRKLNEIENMPETEQVKRYRILR